MGGWIAHQLTAGIQKCLIVQGIGQEQGANHTAYHVGTVDASPARVDLGAAVMQMTGLPLSDRRPAIFFSR